MNIDYLKIGGGDFGVLAELNGFNVRVRSGTAGLDVPVKIEIENPDFTPLGYVRLLQSKHTGRFELRIWPSKKKFDWVKNELTDPEKIYSDGGFSLGLSEDFILLGEWEEGKRRDEDGR